MESVENNKSADEVKDPMDRSSPLPKPKIKSKIVKIDSSNENNEKSEKRPKLKRKSEDVISESPTKEPKIIYIDDVPKANLSKNALSTLHEMFRSLNIKIVSQEGPTNAPVFTATIEINGITYSGQGRNKKLAKHAAAEIALKSLVQLKNPGKEPAIYDKPQSSDFSGDAVYKDVNNFDVLSGKEKSSSIPNGERGNGSCNNHGSERTDEDEANETAKTVARAIVYIKKAGNSIYAKNPVMLLNELHPSAKYELISDSGNQSAKYTMAVYIEGQRFEGQGSSKKLSKAAAARSALSIFYNVVVPDTPIIPTETFIPKDGSSLPQKFADHVAQLILDKFDSLIPKYSVLYRRKVLAGFVLSKNYDLKSCEVITLSTGTKCVNGEKMSVNGTVLNDSHAEILSRRGLCSYLYSELEKLADEKQKAKSIFEPKKKSGFKLKSQYKFHLFINTAPCGDARIFSPYDVSLADKHPNRKARGQLRTKIECGEGTIPVKSSIGIQTWDGVLLGERLLTMSCSDKIAKWNVVGIQGALLSNFIEPIYLDSIILGSLFHPCHLYRAVCGRIEKNLSGLNPPYRLSKPRLSGTVNTEKRQIGKTPSLSVNWSIGDTVIEVVNAVTGKTDQNTISRISKCKLFYKFLHLLRKIPTMTGLTKSEGSLLYSYCKESAHDFQTAKRVLFKAMVKAELGEWIKKPMEVDQFEWDIESLEKLFETDAANAMISNSVSYELISDNKSG